VNALQQARSKNEILTGLLYVNTEWNDLHGTLNTHQTPLNKLKEEDLCPGDEALKEINDGFR
jgi:2-oxoglutarate/2-oxoacid ferredoxin oxidoreductase subunit beta